MKDADFNFFSSVHGKTGLEKVSGQSMALLGSNLMKSLKNFCAVARVFGVLLPLICSNSVKQNICIFLQKNCFVTI